MKLRIIEFFGGIGACTQALKKLGVDVEVVDYVEIDKCAVNSYNAINGTDYEPQDITQWNKHFEDIDLIMHGSPCQDFSLAGKQAGGDEGSGTRSSLMYETIRIVEDIKPKYVVWENVKNLLSKNHIHNFNAYLETMEQLGYKNYYQVLNAKDYGIPQNRERVFTISIRNDIEKRFSFPKPVELQLKLKDMLEENVEEKYYLSEDKISSIAHWKAYQKPFERVLGNESVSPTLTARGAGEEHSGMITYCEDLENTANLQEECLNIKKEYVGTYEYSQSDTLRPTQERRTHIGKEVSGTILSSGNHNGIIEAETTVKEGDEKMEKVKDLYGEQERQLFTEDGNVKRYIGSDIIDEFKEGQMATTTFPNGYGHGPRTHNESISLNCVDRPSVKQNLKIRKLAPKECWRLMGFSDEAYEKASKVNNNAQLYKQAGNSIVVDVLEAIFKNLLFEEDTKSEDDDLLKGQIKLDEI